MDRRTIKIRELKYKLNNSREFIRNIIIQCLEMEDGKTLSKSYWGKEALRALENSKE